MRTILITALWAILSLCGAWAQDKPVQSSGPAITKSPKPIALTDKEKLELYKLNSEIQGLELAIEQSQAKQQLNMLKAKMQTAMQQYRNPEWKLDDQLEWQPIPVAPPTPPPAAPPAPVEQPKKQ